MLRSDGSHLGPCILHMKPRMRKASFMGMYYPGKNVMQELRFSHAVYTNY